MRIRWLSVVRLMGLFWVLAYHFFKDRFSGGFIGVDILFTLSGFLITANWLDEYASHQGIDLLTFGRKRLYRLLPPLVLMILVVMPLTLLVKRDFVAGIGPQLASALGFTTNIYEILSGGNYESQFVPHLFLHTWSLAVEVQFYVVWGVVVWLLSKLKLESSPFRGAIFVVSILFFGISIVMMVTQALTVDNYSLVYFSTVTRSFAFFLGSIVAAFSGIRETTVRFRANVGFWSIKRVVLMIVLSIVFLALLGLLLDFNHLSTYLIGLLLANILASLLIYHVRVLNDQTLKLKEPKLFSVLADLSYSIYLFHWPLYVIFGQLTDNMMAVLLTLLFSLIFASLSYYIIEPIVAGKTPVLMDVSLDFSPYYKWFYRLLSVLVLLVVGIIVTAPKVGDFETNLLVSSLYQADQNMNRTHTRLAGDAQAISDVFIIGDSVALRASAAIEELLPEAQLDAAVSRDFNKAYEIYSNHIKSKSLSKTIVLAVGVNSLYNYEEDINRFLKKLPDGHRIILVTPYNIKDGKVPEVRDYELSLAKKYDYVTVADWYQLSLDNPDIWAGTDGVHFSENTEDGAFLYAEGLKKAIKKASKNPAKGEDSLKSKKE